MKTAVCVTVRLLLYLAPIRIADIAQQQLALEFTDCNRFPLRILLTRDQEQTSNRDTWTVGFITQLLQQMLTLHTQSLWKQEP
ncbi:hypothetical protein [Mastigocladopsis repens]|uniref:hypothetical protein n=1 Tax=Mastigocladopsis repens TaxID=221287 RepID=UPI0002E5D22C|nr:hypothetical protein [Mastigocladopsis repens]